MLDDIKAKLQPAVVAYCNGCYRMQFFAETAAEAAQALLNRGWHVRPRANAERVSEYFSKTDLLCPECRGR